MSPASGATINATSVNLDVTFSESVVGVDASDLELSGAASTSATVGTPIDRGGNTWQFPITGLGDGTAEFVDVVAVKEDGNETRFQAEVRLDTPKEIEYYRHGGILHYVLRGLAGAA